MQYDYFPDQPVKHNCQTVTNHELTTRLSSKGPWDKEQAGIAGRCDLLQAKGTVPSNSLWQAFSSFQGRNAKRHSSPILQYHD